MRQTKQKHIIKRASLRDYIRLTKPGVLAGNVLTAIGGFLLASAGTVDWAVFVAMASGITLIIASACVINNYLDQDIDRAMERTRTRPSVSGTIPDWHMVTLGTALGIAGAAVLLLWTNWLTLTLGLAGFVIYVWIYGAWSKRRSIHGTLVGSISGALPIAGGYAAVDGRIDTGLIIVFLILFFWQFPAFYSIAIYLRQQYAAANVPVMTVVKGVPQTIRQIFIYTWLYVAATLALTVTGYTGYIYAASVALVGGYWLYLATLGLSTRQPEVWARRMFRFGLRSLMLLCLLLAVGPILP